MVSPAMSRAVDLMHRGRDRVICAYFVEGLIVDPGPASCVEALLDALGDERPSALLLTHIHLDHAGATGVLVRRFPDLQVYVHERGAPHLVDPSKLMRSAAQLYGDELESLWGEVAPVPEANVRALSGGERVGGFRVEYTPGHASHHVSYLHESSGDAYTGDVAGVRITPAELVSAPTPPPDIDLEAWELSLRIVEEWRPGALCLTHFGRFTDVEAHLERFRERLLAWAELARDTDEEGFVETTEAEIRSETDPDTAASFMQAGPADLHYRGLERYWRKKAEREKVEAG